MPYQCLNDFIKMLESQGELLRISHPVSPELEISEVYDRVVKNNGPALLFENTGTSFPVLINAYGSEKRICLALGVESLDDMGLRFEELFKEALKSRQTLIQKLQALPLLNKLSKWMPATIAGKAPCQEVVMENPDITKLPILKCWPFDGGNFITLPLVHTVDPDTGIRNIGMYRMQVFDSCSTGMHWHLHKGSAKHYRKYAEQKKRMPVSVVLGGDPIYTYAATAPLPENIDEYILAGFLRQKKVKLVKCLTNTIEVPANADFVIEGYVDPSENLVTEGPFGDHTGFYSLADKYPVFHITCITHRKNAIYPATVVGIPPQEDCWLGKATERLFITPIRLTMLPEIIDMHMPFEGVFHNLVIVKITNEFPGHAQRVMNALWGAGQMMFNKILIVVGPDTDVHDYAMLLRLFCENFDIENDILFGKGPLDVLDHSSKQFAYGGKIGFDLTGKKNKESIAARFPDTSKFVDLHEDIASIESGFFNNGIPLMLIALKANKKNTAAQIAAVLAGKEEFKDIKYIVFTELGLNLKINSDVVWFVANNIDAARDIHVIDGAVGSCTKLIIDGTVKNASVDSFQREWPNVLVMNEEVIQKVDRIWSSLNLGKFIPSPSHNYRGLVSNEGAVLSRSKNAD